ncbi:uncharacterized protein Ecym_2309 [Eremothecium cymbalariae DBVPG|uniref:Eisosome protein 1 n=1 Tax=Eremothecium cymbalariae (strain CBS 270.75 / DBVPG 7215 / KCTC 17166 / NRRL Y-17582) TaxID=931890 RepID=G8JQ49_ERECY|nr:Hypothetical protein Ecym_2309 [Eremothecium cymbalariae DBVPG\
MSLVSAAVDKGNAGVGGGSRRSVYQKDGKPLSKEALYRSKLKYGVFQSPARGSKIGVSDSKVASDAAAHRASSNKTSIESYKRLSVDENASKAATKANLQSQERPQTSSITSSVTGSSEASVGSARAASRKRQAVSGGPKEGANPRLGNMDITKVLEGAERAANKRIVDRINPVRQNYTYGLITGDKGRTGETNYSLTSSVVEQLKTKGEYVTEAENEADPNHIASHASNAALSHDPTESMDREAIERQARNSEYFKQLSSRQVLDLARARADLKLKQIDKETKDKLIFSNEEYNKVAVEIAKKHHEERQRLTGGKVNLGGGLWLAPEEVEHIAQGFITPVLADVDKRAVQQRAVDADIQRRTMDHEQKYAEWKALQKQKHDNDVLAQREARERHEQELGSVHEVFEDKLYNLVKEKKNLINEKEEELVKVQESYAKLKAELDDVLAQEATRVEKVFTERQTELEEDIATIKKENLEAIQPLDSELETKRIESDKLVAEHDQVKDTVDGLSADVETYKAKIAELNQQLLSVSATLQEQQEGLRALHASKDELEAQIDNNLVAASQASERAELSRKDVDLKRKEVDSVLSEYQAKLERAQDKLSKERSALLQTSLKVSQLKGMPSINESKARSLIGITSDEYLSKFANKKTKQPKKLTKHDDDSVEYIIAVTDTSPATFTNKKRGIFPNMKSRGSTSAATGQPSAKQRKIHPSAAYISNSPKKDSALGRFLQKIIPSKKNGSKKTNTNKKTPVARSSTVPVARKFEHQKKPVYTDSSQDVLGPGRRDHAKATDEEVDADDVRELLELERSNDSKDRRESLFKEVF